MNKTQNKKSDNRIDENMPKMNINWLITIYLNPLATPYKYRDSTNLDLTHFG